jgi:hypothetical protein
MKNRARDLRRTRDPRSRIVSEKLTMRIVG